MDFRALSHVTGQRASLELFHNEHSNYNISIADKASQPISRIGSTNVSSNSGKIELPQVLYIPTLCSNLISIESLPNNRHEIHKSEFNF